MRASIILAIAITIPLCFESAQALDCVRKASEGLEGGHAQSVVWALKRGAGRGDARCQFILGMWSLSGAKAEQNPDKGLRLLREAAKDGLPIAQSSLGLLYASGLVVEQDEEKAARLYRKAAEYGDPLGQTAIALASFRGVGVPENRIDAYQWMSLAAAQGNEDARAYLPAVEGTLSADELEIAKADVAKFRPKERKGERRPSKKELLSLVGLNRPPGEIERFYGLGGGVER
jgi:hypothetical protein